MKQDDLKNSFELNLLKILLEKSCCSISHPDKSSVLDKVFKISVALGHDKVRELLEIWLINAKMCMSLLTNESNRKNPFLMWRTAITLSGSCKLLGLEKLADLCLTVDYKTIRIDSFYEIFIEQMTFEVRTVEPIFESVLKTLASKPPQETKLCAARCESSWGILPSFE